MCVTQHVESSLGIRTFFKTANAMVTNHLRAPYSVYFHQTSYNSTAPVCVDKNNRTIISHLFQTSYDVR